MRAICAAAETGHIHPDVTWLVDVLGRHGLDLRDLATEGTNDGYGAATAHCRDSVVRLRVGRTTPKKPGHFVAAWRRDLDDRPVPLDDGDGTAALIVIARRDPDAGVFVLTRPKMRDPHLDPGTTTRPPGRAGSQVAPPITGDLHLSRA